MSSYNSHAHAGAPASPTGGVGCPAECPPPCCPQPACQWGEELTAEARARLVAGLERYFHAKRGEGLLSTEGLRILSYACDVAADRAIEPLVSPSVLSALLSPCPLPLPCNFSPGRLLWVGELRGPECTSVHVLCAGPRSMKPGRQGSTVLHCGPP